MSNDKNISEINKKTWRSNIFIPIGIPAVILGILFVVYSVWASKKEGKINHEAHIGGAVWGIIYMFAFIPNSIDHFLTMIGIL